jgi:RNA polymerase sigma factor (sigma-70 family)
VEGDVLAPAAGDAAFAQVFAAERHRLEAVAARITRDADAAQDVVAAAAARVWSRLARAPVDDLVAYLFRAVRNEALSHLRRLRRERALSAALVASGTTSPSAVASAVRPAQDRVDDRDEVDRLLATLPSAQARTLRLRYDGGLSEAEIARAMGIPNGTVKSNAHRALQRLRAERCADPAVAAAA